MTPWLGNLGNLSKFVGLFKEVEEHKWYQGCIAFCWISSVFTQFLVN